MFQRRHYQAIAKVLKAQRPIAPTKDPAYTGPKQSHEHQCYAFTQLALDNTAESLARMFAHDNPNFDHDRFMEATR